MLRRLAKYTRLTALVVALGLTGCPVGSQGPATVPSTPSTSVVSPGEPSGSSTFSSPGGSSLPAPGAAGAGGADTMPPRADTGDCMTIGIDGSIYCGPPIRQACRILYVPAPKIKVLPGTEPPYPPIPAEGKSTFDGRFLAEIGSAGMSCEDESCWTWDAMGIGDILMMRLTRLQTSAPALTFHQEATILLPAEDGANVSVSGVSIHDEDVIEFYATFSDLQRPGYSETLAPLTDEVWTGFGIKCDMGGFRIDTGEPYMKPIKPLSPLRDGVLEAIKK